MSNRPVGLRGSFQYFMGVEDKANWDLTHFNVAFQVFQRTALRAKLIDLQVFKKIIGGRMEKNFTDAVGLENARVKDLSGDHIITSYYL